MSPSSYCQGVTFRPASLNCTVKKNQEKFLKIPCCLELPAGSFQDPFSPSLRLANLGPIVKSLHWTSMAPDPFAIFIPLASPKIWERCQGEVKCPEIMTVSLEGKQLEEEPLCTKMWLVTREAVWAVQVLSQQKQILSHWSKDCMPWGWVMWV